MGLNVKIYVSGLIALAASTCIAAGATKSGVIDATYGDHPLSPPTPSVVFICHGFGCKYRTELDLTANDHVKLAQILAGGRSSPAAERKAIGAAGAWFDRRVGPVAGTANHVVRAGAEHMFDTGNSIASTPAETPQVSCWYSISSSCCATTTSTYPLRAVF